MQKQQGKAIALNPRGIWVLSQVVLPGKLGSWLAQAAQELTNPQVWITAPLPCVFSLRGKRLKIRTDTTLDLCDMECNCCLHCTSENSLHTKNGWPQPVLKGCPQTKWENNYSVKPRRKVGRPLRRWHAKLQEFCHREFPQHTTWLEAAQSPEWPGALIVFAIPTSTVELLTFCPMSFKDRSFELERAQSNVICPCQCQVLD